MQKKYISICRIFCQRRYGMKNKKRMKSTAVALIVVMIFSMFSLACSNSGNKPAGKQETPEDTAPDIVEIPKIVDLCVNDYITIAVKSDGTISWVGGDENTQSIFGNWVNISKVVFSPSSGEFCLGLKNDGTVVATV